MGTSPNTLGLSRRVALSVSSFMLLPGILRTTDLTAVLPRRLLAEVEGLALREPPLDISGFTKVLAWHERSQSDPGRVWARDLLLRTCPSPLQALPEGQPAPS